MRPGQNNKRGSGVVQRRLSCALALIASVCTSGALQAKPAVVEDRLLPRAEGALTGEEIAFANDVFVLATALYWEGGSTNESVEGQRRIAEVIKMRARLDRRDFGGRDLWGVVFHSHKGKKGNVCQFSFACLPSTKRAPFPGYRWELAKRIAEEAMFDRAAPEHDEIAEYYLNPEFSSLRSICWFKSNLVSVGQTGRHIFWREPKSWDQPVDRSVKPDECVAYEESLKKKTKVAAKPKTKAKEKQAAAAVGKPKKKKYASAVTARR